MIINKDINFKIQNLVNNKVVNTFIVNNPEYVVKFNNNDSIFSVCFYSIKDINSVNTVETFKPSLDFLIDLSDYKLSGVNYDEQTVKLIKHSLCDISELVFSTDNKEIFESLVHFVKTNFVNYIEKTYLLDTYYIKPNDEIPC
jgi:hypothetical protein